MPKAKQPSKKWFTVVGVYDDSGQVYAQGVEAFDAMDAIGRISKIVIKDGQGNDLQIAGAIEGEHKITPPCAESGKTAYASDLDYLAE